MCLSFCTNAIIKRLILSHLWLNHTTSTGYFTGRLGWTRCKICIITTLLTLQVSTKCCAKANKFPATHSSQSESLAFKGFEQMSLDPTCNMHISGVKSYTISRSDLIRGIDEPLLPEYWIRNSLCDKFNVMLCSTDWRSWRNFLNPAMKECPSRSTLNTSSSAVRGRPGDAILGSCKGWFLQKNEDNGTVPPNSTDNIRYKSNTYRLPYRMSRELYNRDEYCQIRRKKSSADIHFKRGQTNCVMSRAIFISHHYY